MVRGLVLELAHGYGVRKILGFRYGYEGLISRFEFKQLLDAKGAQVIQPEVIHCGGITEIRKIAALGEGPVAWIEAGCGGRKRAVRVRVVLEDAAHDFPRDATCRRDHLRPRTNSS